MFANREYSRFAPHQNQLVNKPLEVGDVTNVTF